MSYELKINVKKGVVMGGGLSNNAYVEVWIDGMLVETTQSVPSPPEWNKEVVKEFDNLEPATPIIISFSMYKKRWTSEGYKLVGTAQFPLADLAEKLDKGPVYRMISLISSKRNITLSGTLQLVLDLRTMEPCEADTSREGLLANRASIRIRSGGGVIRNLLSAMKPKSQLSVEEAKQLGIISRLYRYIFHFQNQVFGRFVKLMVVLVWLAVIKYSMGLYTEFREGLERVEERTNTVQQILNQILSSELSPPS
mmetsp:Transcript_81241/g.159455  ORF Transcript_81241/g.159455 Transcript_81241/m.159455 type:complete len:253 (-) Transcript_81241:140-898(-)